MAEPTQHTFPSEEGTAEEELEYLLGEATDLLQAGRLDEAKREIERALSLRPGHEQARNLLGLTLFRLGDLEPALETFAGLVHDNPVEPSLRLNLAMVHLKAGRLTDAHEELERALDLNPDHKRAASYMAMVCERLERHVEAAEWYVRAGNEAQAAAARARAESEREEAGDGVDEARGARGADDDVPRPPPVLSSEGAAVGELMPKPGAREVADGEVQAAALSALRAEALSRPSSPPSPADASSAREASKEFTLDVDDVGDVDDAPASPAAPAGADEGYVDPFADEEEAPESTRPYAPNPYFGAGGDVVVSVRDIAAPTRRAPEVALTPVEVSPDEVELRALGSEDEDEPQASAEAAPPAPVAEEIRAVPAPVDTTASEVARPTTEREASGRALPSLTLDDLGARGANADATQPFLDEDGLVVFPVREAAYLRTDLLVGLRGSFEVEPVYRRYRGRRTDSFFGGSKSPLAAALGDGRAWLDPSGAEVTVLALSDEELYLVEGTLLAFTSGLAWENGRLPEQGGRDLDVVHLRGSGRVVLQTKRALRAIESGEQPVTVAATRLVGWAGSLVPSRGLFPGLPDTVERPSIVRFEGSGRILVV